MVEVIRSIVIAFVLMVLGNTAVMAQGYVNTEYISESKMKDKAGDPYGKGGMLRFSGRYTLPLSVKKDTLGRIRAWTATVNGSYALLHNEGEARTFNPDEILNVSANVSHICPLGTKWRLIASLGIGLYAEPGDISFQSVLANGAVIFAYNFSDNLSIGVGAGLTNSYGAPMVLPMGYLMWETGGQFKLSVDMASGLKVKASTWIGSKWQMELTAIEMDGMSAVMKVDGRSKIYSSTMMKTHFCLSYHFSKQMSVYMGLGGSWMRSIRLSDRNLKSFFKGFGSDENKYRFSPALWVTTGLRYKF